MISIFQIELCFPNDSLQVQEKSLTLHVYYGKVSTRLKLFFSFPVSSTSALAPAVSLHGGPHLPSLLSCLPEGVPPWAVGNANAFISLHDKLRLGFCFYTGNKQSNAFIYLIKKHFVFTYKKKCLRFTVYKTLQTYCGYFPGPLQPPS